MSDNTPKKATASPFQIASLDACAPPSVANCVATCFLRENLSICCQSTRTELESYAHGKLPIWCAHSTSVGAALTSAQKVGDSNEKKMRKNFSFLRRFLYFL